MGACLVEALDETHAEVHGALALVLREAAAGAEGRQSVLEGLGSHVATATAAAALCARAWARLHRRLVPARARHGAARPGRGSHGRRGGTGCGGGGGGRGAAGWHPARPLRSLPRVPLCRLCPLGALGPAPRLAFRRRLGHPHRGQVVERQNRGVDPPGDWHVPWRGLLPRCQHREQPLREALGQHRPRAVGRVGILFHEEQEEVHYREDLRGRESGCG